MRPTIIAYAAALVCVAVGVGIRVLLAPVLQGQTPYISVFIALAFIAYRFGVGPAVTAMFAGAVGIALLIIKPAFSFSNTNHLVGFAAYFIVSSALIAVLNLLSQTQRRKNEERERLQQEVLARQKAEATQALASTRLRMAAEAVNGIIYEFDFQSQTVERTRGLFEVLGHRPEDVAATAQWWFDQIHPDDLKIFEPRLQAAMESGESLLLEYRVRHKDGHWLDVEDRAIVVADNAGKLSKIFGCAVNITERKRAERALQESESILRNIYESSPLMMGLVEVLDDDSDILHVYDSPAVDRFLGTGEGTTSGKLASENGVPPQIIALWVSNYRACQRTMKPVRFEYEHVAESGSVWLSCVVTCIGEHGSGRTRFSYISEDITERKQAEEVLQTERSRLALGVQVAGLAIAEIDYTTGLNYLSDEAARLFGFGEKATIVQRDEILNAFHPEDRRVIAERIQEILKPDGPGWFVGVHRVMWPSGEVRWLRVRKQVFFKGEGEQRRAVRATIAALDVTAERNAADAMMASEQFVRGVLNSLPEHVVVLNNKGSVLAFNEPWERFSDSNGGLRQSVSEGADYLEVCRIAADQGDPYAKAAFNGLQAVIESRSQSFTLEYPCHSQDLERWFFMHAQRTQFGPAGVILSHIDITDRVLAENRLRESQDRLFQALDAAHMICFEWDIARDEVRRSFSGTSALPKTDEDRPWTFEQVVQAIAPADQAAFRENVERALASENGDYSSEYRLLDKDGGVKWYFERGRVEFDANHRPLRLTGLSQDISARKCAEEALKESESRFRVALRDSGIVVYTTDAELRYTWVHNQHASLPINNIIGYRDDEIFPADQALPLLTLKRRVLEGGVGETAISTMNFDGDERIYNVSVEPLRDSRGNIVGVTAAAMEITAMKKAEQRIHTLLEELRAADRRKDEFLATLAHELRNPLAPIRNAIELMKHVTGDSDLLEQLQTTMNRQVGHMVRLIDDLLDVSRITSNKLELKRERVNLATIMQHASEACKPNCARSEHELHVTVPAEPIHLHADPVRLTQVFVNLLTNSCKYMEDRGQIWFSAHREGNEVVVSVKDAGMGIPPEMLPKIFDLFTQVDQSLERTVGGLGIGLSLVKRLVEMHDGSVVAHSDGHDRGCEVTVRLPILIDQVLPETTAPEASRKSKGTSRRILIVDDNRDAGKSLGLLLKIAGHVVDFAFDGEEAIAKAEQFRPELIVLDIGLPKINGYDACREMRSRDWGKTIKMVALTGWGQAEDRRKSQEAGFDRHLVKPIEYGELTKILAEIGSPAV